MPRWVQPLLLFVLVIVVTAGVGLSGPTARSAGRPTVTTGVQLGGAGRVPAVQPVVQIAAVRPADVGGAGAFPAARPLHEVHWQGIEVIPLTPKLKRELDAVGNGVGVPASGVVIDQVSFPADGQGFGGGDVITIVGGIPTPTLAAFVAAADVVRERSQVAIEINRRGQPLRGVLTATRLGTANGETAPEIPPGAIPPHGCAQAHAVLLHRDTLGPCSQCHPIRKPAQPPTDLNQILPEAKRAGPPVIDPACLPVP